MELLLFLRLVPFNPLHTHPSIFNLTMHWSPLGSIFIVLTVTSILESVSAAPLDVVLEKRGGDKSKETKKLTTSSLKTSSSTYRKAALGGTSFTTQGKGVTEIATPKSPPKGKDAGR